MQKRDFTPQKPPGLDRALSILDEESVTVQIRYEYPVTTYRQSKQLLLPYISRKNSTSKGKLAATYKMWGQAWASPPRCKTTRAALLPPPLLPPTFATVGVFSPPGPSFGCCSHLMGKLHAHSRVRTLKRINSISI